MHSSQINILIFIFLMFKYPRVHLQEDSHIYSYGIVYFTCISISSLGGRRVLNTLLYLLDCL